MQRCAWAGTDPQMIAYHDTEWGVPIRDDVQLFAKLSLDMFQAGLSWRTILHKRDSFLKAFDNFDPVKVAKYDQLKYQELLDNPQIVRNKLKIQATIHNAQMFLKFRAEQGSFSKFLWSFVKNQTVDHQISENSPIPANSPESDAMSKGLKQIGFKFAGTTVCYAFMQAVGMVNDHHTDCFRYSEVK
jgi:DNA-3-methyladenine glycosylase I